jgi:23S rRNA pseudouridine1911/1915/1917 synthase
MKKISELILFKDHHLMAFNKPAGLLSQEDPSGDIHAHRMAMAYAHRDLFVVHRLDRRVSGVLVFAKTKTAAAALSKQWEERKVKKNYLGIVPVADVPHNAQLQHYLTYDQKQNITIVHQSPVPGADEAILHYQVLQQFENFMLLRIDLISGRKHQIRAQLSAAGIPIRYFVAQSHGFPSRCLRFMPSSLATMQDSLTVRRYTLSGGGCPAREALRRFMPRLSPQAFAF